jgi:hypothetical protein
MSKQGKVINFFDHVPLRYRLDAGNRAYGRFRADQHRRLKEREEKRNREEVRQDE